MKIAIFQFSGTGNTFFTSCIIQEEFAKKEIECDVFSIEREEEYNIIIEKYDIVGFGYPIYVSDMPIIYKKFVDKLQITKKRAFVFCTQMLVSGDGAAVGARTIKKKGFMIRQQEHFNLPNNISDFKILKFTKKIKYGKIMKRTKKKANKFVFNIIGNKRKRKGSNVFSFLIGFMQRGPFKKFEGSLFGNAIKVDDDDCIKCNKCVELCPVGNLIIEDKVVTRGLCIACYRCINYCPTNSLHIGKNKPFFKYQGPQKDFNISEVHNNKIAVKKEG